MMESNSTCVIGVNHFFRSCVIGGATTIHFWSVKVGHIYKQMVYMHIFWALLLVYYGTIIKPFLYINFIFINNITWDNDVF